MTALDRGGSPNEPSPQRPAVPGYCPQGCRSPELIGREPRVAASGLLQERGELGEDGPLAVWSAATKLTVPENLVLILFVKLVGAIVAVF